MNDGISESRFYMWRAVFALAHADHHLKDDERAYMEHYLNVIAFSDGQKQTLREDIATAQSVQDMFSQISEPEDRGSFFQFARNLIWCDGDAHEQEQAIQEYLKDLQMRSLNLDMLREEIAQSRVDAAIPGDLEDAPFEDTAKGLIGLGRILHGMGQGVADLLKKANPPVR